MLAVARNDPDPRSAVGQMAGQCAANESTTSDNRNSFVHVFLRVCFEAVSTIIAVAMLFRLNPEGRWPFSCICVLLVTHLAMLNQVPRALNRTKTYIGATAIIFETVSNRSGRHFDFVAARRKG